MGFAPCWVCSPPSSELASRRPPDSLCVTLSPCSCHLFSLFWFELGLAFNIDQSALTDMRVSMARETAQGIQALNKSQLLCQHFNSENDFPVCLNLKSPPVELWVDRGQLRPCSSGQRVASSGYKGPQGSPQPQGGDLCCVLFLQQPTQVLLLGDVLHLLTTCSVVSEFLILK